MGPADARPQLCQVSFGSNSAVTLGRRYDSEWDNMKRGRPVDTNATYGFG